MVKVKDILETNKVILLFEGTYKKYRLFEDRLYEICKNSSLYTKTKIFFSRIIIIFQYSFLGRITENKEGDNLKEIFENSKFVNWVLKIYNDRKKRVAGYLNTSLTVKHAIRLKNELNILPVKIVSIIVITAILSNLFFYTMFKNSLQKEIGLLSWIIKGMLLFMGLAGLFCKVSLKNLRSTSLFLKWINRYKQSDLEEK